MSISPASFTRENAGSVKHDPKDAFYFGRCSLAIVGGGGMRSGTVAAVLEPRIAPDLVFTGLRAPLATLLVKLGQEPILVSVITLNLRCNHQTNSRGRVDEDRLVTTPDGGGWRHRPRTGN